MTDDIDWKQKCRKVAGWLGEVVSGDMPPGHLAHKPWLLDEDAGEWWPDYTRDDAAAWRMMVAMPAWWAMMRGMSLYEVGPVEYGQGLSTKAEHEDPKKALVLAACHLIDKGEDPRRHR